MVHAILKNPYRASGGSHHSGNKMALANVRERLALHFDAEASLDSRVIKDAYEVHIRIPYRTEATNTATGVPTVTGPMPATTTSNPRFECAHHRAGGRAWLKCRFVF